MIRTVIAAACLVSAVAVGMAPIASAQPSASGQQPYPNCKAAAKDGRYNIPSSDPAYGPWLDRDNDGVGCERH